MQHFDCLVANNTTETKQTKLRNIYIYIYIYCFHAAQHGGATVTNNTHSLRTLYDKVYCARLKSHDSRDYTDCDCDYRPENNDVSSRSQ